MLPAVPLRRPPPLRPLLYAHRGASRHAPENTLAAFRLAVAQGADGVELDVRTCRTGEVVVVHDPTLARVGGGDRRAVHELSWDELRRADVGDGERPPLLDEAIDLVVGAGLLLNVEVKGDVPDQVALARQVAAVLRRRAPHERRSLVLSSFRPRILAHLAVEIPRVPAALLWDAEHSGQLRAAVVRRVLPIAGVHPHFPLATRPHVLRWHLGGRFVNVWTVDRPEDVRRVAAAGVDGIVTNDVPTARAALRT